MTDAKPAAAAPVPAAAAAAPVPVAKEKKALTKSQHKRKVAKIHAWLRSHPRQLEKERGEHALWHLYPKKEQVGATKPVEGKEEEKKKEKKSAKQIQVPESVRIRQQIRVNRRASALRKREAVIKRGQRFRSVLIRRAERHMAEYKSQERSLIYHRRVARMTGNFFREPDARLILVIRIKGIMGLSPRVRKILRLFRLPQINNATFVRVNKATLQMLRLVSPYVAFGYPNLATVRKLLYKRGYANYRGKRTALVDNSLIKQRLGKYNIVCMEDLIHELYTVGPHFKQANKFLWAFKLSNPRGGFVHKSTTYVEGGDSGNREEKINEFVRKML